MSRLSVSSRTWSHQLPNCLSAGLDGSQCLSFFSHKGPGFIGLNPLGLDVLDHLGMKALGVLAGLMGEAENGVERDAAQAAGGAHTVALDKMVRDVERLLVGEMGAIQRRAGPFGEVFAAGGAAEAANAACFAGPAVGPQVAESGLGAVGTVGIRAGEGRPVALAHKLPPSASKSAIMLANQDFGRKAEKVTTQFCNDPVFLIALWSVIAACRHRG